jgi:fatty-acyl-CoA synthase
MDISRWVAHRADWSPDKVAVHGEAAAITYAQMEGRVARRAGALRDGLGVRAGDRVAHLGLNSPDLLDLLFACARIGAMLVPLNWRLAPVEHAAMLADAQPAALLAETEFQAAIDPVLAGRPATRAVRWRGSAAGAARAAWIDDAALLDAAAPVPPGSGGDLASPVLLVYTSGTTGRAKGALLTQEALFYNAVNSIAAVDMTSADHVLTVLPMFHVGGLNIQTTPAVHAGATVTIARRFDAGRTLECIAAGRPTLFLAVPTVAQAVAGHPRFAETDLSCLRCMTTGSSVVPEAVIRSWLDRGVPVTQVYGLTESAPTAIALPLADAFRKPGSCGKPVPHCEARIVDVAGRDVPRGERGEIWLRGPNLVAGYWGDPAATADAYTDGWFHTGDIGHQDSEGYFYVDDRKTDVVISGGENVYPAELERVLAECPDIAEAAVVSRPDPRWGEVPVACVVARPGARLTRDGVLALFRDRLARFKHPRDVVFLDALPRTALGKVQKFELRQRLALPAGPA